MGQYIHDDKLVKWTDDKLIQESEKLKDLFTPNGKNWDKLVKLLEIERELTLREEQ